MLDSPLISSIAIGDERLLIYNDAAAKLYGARHPAAFGEPLPNAFPDSYPDVAAFYDRVFAGEAVKVAGQPLDVGTRGNGTVFDAYLTPVLDDDGTVIAAHMVGLEIGERLRAEAKLRESEERLRGVLDGMGEGFGVIGPDFTILEHNREALRMDGRPKAEIVGRSHWDAFPGTEHSEVGQLLKRAMADRQPAFLEHLYAWEEGRALWLELRVYPLADGALAVFWRDVTVRKTAEAALRESEEKFRIVADNIAQLTWTCDSLGNVNWYNKRWFDFTGLTFEDMKSWGWDRVQHPDHVERVVAGVKRAAASGEPWEDTFPLRRRDGEYRWFYSRAMPIRDRDGTIVQWFGTNTDITEARWAEDALRESEERLTFLLELSDALRPLTDPGEIEREATRLLGEHLNADRCFLSPVYDDGTGMCVREEYLRSGASSVLGDYTFAQFGDFVGPELHAGHVLAVEDVGDLTGLSAAERESYATVAIGAYLLIPLIREGRLAAFLTINHQTPRGWSEADKAVARQTADRLWAARERGLAQEALRDSEELRRLALRGGRFGAWRWDLAGRLVWGDAHFMALYGLSPTDEAVDLAVFTERMAPDNAAEMEVIVTRAIEAGEEFDGPIRIAAGPTAGRWVQWRGRTAPGDPTVLQGVTFDITEQKRTEAVQTSQRTALEMLTRGASLRDVVEFQIATLETYSAGRLVGSVALLDEAEARFVTSIGAGLPESYHEAVEGMAVSSQTGSCCRAVVARDAVIVTDVTADPQWTRFADFIVPLGFRAAWSTPIFGSDGRILGTFANYGAEPQTPTDEDLAFVDGITRSVALAVERKRADDALRESEERLRQFGEASQDVLWVRDAETFQWEYLTPAFETIYGLDRTAALRGDNMAGWLELVVPEDRKHADESLQRVRQGEWVTFEYRIRRPVDGAIRWLRNTDFPIQDGSGTVKRIGGIGHDITELKRTEEALAAAELQQRALLEGMPQLVWRAVDSGQWTWASPQWTDYTGQNQLESHGNGWLEPVHPDDRDQTRAKWSKAIESGGFEVDYRICNASTQAYRWFHTRATAVRDEHGSIVEWLGTSTDIDDLRRLQDLQKTLLAELQHRVRNILAVIRSMVRRSSETPESLSDYVQHLEGRISAMARTQVLLTRSVDARVDLESLICDELVAQAADESRISLTGPPAALGPKAAEVVSLAIHELTTNAIKYGALSRASATLQVSWHIEDRADIPWLRLMWSEVGVPIANIASRREGFGSELITRRVPYELRGKGTLEMRPDGILCELEFPLKDRASILQTDARSLEIAGGK